MSSAGFVPEKRQSRMFEWAIWKIGKYSNKGCSETDMKIGSYFIVNWTLRNVQPLNNSDVQAPFIL